MTTKHTPGPWKVSKSYSGQYNLWAGKILIGCLDASLPHNESDIKLIASAPDLLEALKTILLNLDPEDDHPRHQHVLYSDCLGPENDDQTVVQYLKGVIAKAEGE